MAHMAIPMIAFHGVESIYIYTCIFILCYICIVYVVKEVHHSRGLDQLMAMVHNAMPTWKIKVFDCVTYIETGSNNYSNCYP